MQDLKSKLRMIGIRGVWVGLASFFLIVKYVASLMVVAMFKVFERN